LKKKNLTSWQDSFARLFLYEGKMKVEMEKREGKRKEN
jgi:hypothetical protein